jgi:hypothetical protein
VSRGGEVAREAGDQIELTPVSRASDLSGRCTTTK